MFFAQKFNGLPSFQKVMSPCDTTLLIAIANCTQWRKRLDVIFYQKRYDTHYLLNLDLQKIATCDELLSLKKVCCFIIAMFSFVLSTAINGS